MISLLKVPCLARYLDIFARKDCLICNARALAHNKATTS